MSYLTMMQGQWDYTKGHSQRVVLDDVLNSLSRKVRYNGHLSQSYTVGQHTVHVVEAMWYFGASREELLAALIHDWPEAVVCDWPAPMKASMPKEALDWLAHQEDQYLLAVCDQLNLPEKTYELASKPRGLLDLFDKAICIPEAMRFQRGVDNWHVPAELKRYGVLSFPDPIVAAEAWEPWVTWKVLNITLNWLQHGYEHPCPTTTRWGQGAEAYERTVSRYADLKWPRQGTDMAAQWDAMQAAKKHKTFSLKGE